MTTRIIATQSSASMHWHWLVDDNEAAALRKAASAGRIVMCQRKTETGYELIVREKP